MPHGLENTQSLRFAQLATDPYEQLGFIVHEAFHVFQDRVAATKGANELFLLHYPVLSVENNVGFAQQGAALAAALRSERESEFKAAMTRWLAVRRHRRAALGEARAVRLKLPGVRIVSPNATIQWDGTDLRVILAPPR